MEKRKSAEQAAGKRHRFPCCRNWDGGGDNSGTPELVMSHHPKGRVINHSLPTSGCKHPCCRLVTFHAFKVLPGQCLIGFPGSSAVKIPPANAGLIPGVGKMPWRRKWQPTPVLLPGEFHGQRSLVGYRPWGRKETQLSTHSFKTFF